LAHYLPFELLYKKHDKYITHSPNKKKGLII
jgi:hypothetical protein